VDQALSDFRGCSGKMCRRIDHNAEFCVDWLDLVYCCLAALP